MTDSSQRQRYDVVDLISAKRWGQAHTDDEIRWWVSAFTGGHVVPEQMSAWLMAVVFRGLSRTELFALTSAMIDSGERMSFRELGRPAIDKHSTGGVGDKTTLILVPLLASLGVAVPQLSGRGLGHTGGTLDKLESIPGWRAELERDEMERVLADTGGVICAASAQIAPADRKLYALRDVTGTVASVPLIASSIMSKKIAEGASGLVLDVKFGSGAFLPDANEARELARTMVELGDDAGLATTALLTDMDAPLGQSVGNANEVAEAVAVLRGGGSQRLRALTLALAHEMLVLAGRGGEDPAAALDDGRAWQRWRELIRAQGGDPDAQLPRAAAQRPVLAAADGTVQRVDAREVGVAAWRLGAGRDRPGASIVHGAGIEVLVQPGDRVSAGDVLFEIACDEPDRVERARPLLERAVTLGPEAPVSRPLIVERITSSRTDE